MTDHANHSSAEVDANSMANFALAYAQLCEIAYEADHSKIAGLVAKGGVHTWTNGNWECVWGPAVDPENANLVYVAKFTPDGSGDLPTYVVVIRGTDIIEHLRDIKGDDKQLREDLEVGNQSHVDFPGADESAAIAQGTLMGLTTIQGLFYPNEPGLRYDQRNLSMFMVSELESYSAELPPVVVTGHSLGGCLTTVVAPYLLGVFQDKSLHPKILPYTFAGPSAGNAAFAQYFDQSFAPNYRYFNSLDIIPHWWASLDALKTIYPAPPEMPLLIKIFFDVKRDEMEKHGVSYVQPSSVNIKLDGHLQGLGWREEAAYQHHISTYISLLGGMSILL